MQKHCTTEAWSPQFSFKFTERTNLSGGEKRRVTLARSILRETPILILDEPLANLDEKNAKAIESQLLSIKDRTLIIISHQFSSENISKLDEIIEFK